MKINMPIMRWNRGITVRAPDSEHQNAEDFIRNQSVQVLSYGRPRLSAVARVVNPALRDKYGFLNDCRRGVYGVNPPYLYGIVSRETFRIIRCVIKSQDPTHRKPWECSAPSHRKQENAVLRLPRLRRSDVFGSTPRISFLISEMFCVPLECPAAPMAAGRRGVKGTEASLHV